MKEKEVTEKILRAYYTVYNTLGYGVLERVYENAMLIELKKQGLECIQQKATDVYYDYTIVGEYYADILVNDLVIVELKSAES
jgi:GxxExxY protein